MTKPTGKPVGRPKGAADRTQRIRGPAKRKIKMDEKIAQVAERVPDAFKGDAHALLISVYTDPAFDMPLRMDAAKAAIRFEKPALASQTIKPLDLTLLTDEELHFLDRMYTRIERQRGSPAGNAAPALLRSQNGNGSKH